jgi:hypothetical protein
MRSNGNVRLSDLVVLPNLVTKIPEVASKANRDPLGWVQSEECASLLRTVEYRSASVYCQGSCPPNPSRLIPRVAHE